MSNVLTISGQKGGTGKSVTAVNLAVSLALFEKKVLLIDCDPQGSATEWAGVGALEHPFDIACVLAGKQTIAQAIAHTEFHYLDMLPAGFDLFYAALKLAGSVSNEKILRLLIEPVRSDYDYILIDGPSSYGFLSVCAVTAADWLLVPLTPWDNGATDVYALLKLINYVRKTHETPLKIAGILFNRCDREEINQFLVDQNLSETQGLVYDTCIPSDKAVIQSIAHKMPLALYDVKSLAAQAYLNLAKEMILVFNKT